MFSDAQLVTRVRSGDVEAFGELVRRHERSVLAVALAKLRDVHAAEDIVQETLLLAFRRLGSLNDGAKFDAWLVAIARRQVAEALRSRQLAVDMGAGEWTLGAAEDARLQIWIEHEAVLNLLSRLSPEQQALVGHRYFDGHSVAEIAAMTGRPVGTVTKQLSRAIACLRSWSKKETSR